MKAFTDISQSRKLAEFLPLESADMGWNVFVDGTTRILPINDWDLIKDGSSNVKFCHAWSLAALFGVLPSVIKRNGKRLFLTLEKEHNLYYKSPNRLDELWETREDVIDACYEMIIRLNELKLL